MRRLDEVRQFWFADACVSPASLPDHQARWFTPDAAIDSAVGNRFGTLPDQVLSDALPHNPEDPYDLLALVLILDQFPRQLYRNTARAFAYDGAARAISKPMIDKALFQALHPVEQAFVFLPLEHSEDLSDQSHSLRLHTTLVSQCPPLYQPFIESTLDYARRHYAIIERFGRFPHRNAILNRISTEDEKQFLAEGGDTFGVAQV
tara:strand:- start:412 stop:1026 length:615 start_codon:yes stop_codon:yes gene_type:complete